MNALVDVPGNPTPEGGVVLPPFEVRGRVDPRLMVGGDRYVVLAAGWSARPETAKLIFEHSREVLAPYKRIRRLEFADLSKTVSGKIRRIELRERTAQGDGGAEHWEEIHR